MSNHIFNKARKKLKDDMDEAGISMNDLKLDEMNREEKERNLKRGEEALGRYEAQRLGYTYEEWLEIS